MQNQKGCLSDIWRMRMSKSIITFKTPKSCDECQICVSIMGKRYCPAKGTEISKGERDCSCPAVAVPEKKDIKVAANMTSLGFIEGWNACIDRILGGNSE